MTNSRSSFSIVMTVYDQASELEQHLPAFLQQVYEPGYEVIVVDETSTDSTEDVLKRFKNDYPQLYTTFLPRLDRKVTRRRMAFTIGAKASKNDWIVLADIRQAPVSQEWLQALSDYTDSSTTEMVLSYVSKKNSLRMVAYDDFNEAGSLLWKTERKNGDGHADGSFKFLKGQYDFLAVRRDLIHDVLKYFDKPLSWKKRNMLNVAAVWHNFFRK